ncbi:MAG: hypothetical protein R2834_13230 [Rhodothermales bacterium]
MTITHEMDVAGLEFHERYVIAKVAYGVHLDPANSEAGIELIAARYQQPFGYISNRINDYSRDYGLYRLIKEKAPNLACIALVIDRPHARAMARIEQRVGNRSVPVEIFADLASAVAWTEEQVERARRAV